MYFVYINIKINNKFKWDAKISEEVLNLVTVIVDHQKYMKKYVIII